MKKDLIKYIFFSVLACLSFMIIDNVNAATGLYIPSTGTYEQVMYSNGDVLTYSTSASDPSVAVFSGKGYFRLGYAVNNGSYRLTYSYRFIWYTTGSYFKDYDSFGFTLGYQPGYVNNLSILMLTDGWESGWIQCTPISLPGSGNDYGTQFSAFSCPYKSSEIDPSKSYTLHAIANSVSSYADLNTSQGAPLLYNPTFYFASDVLLYKNSEDKVVDALKEQTEAINKIYDSDLGDKDKELPDDSSFNDYESTEGELIDKVNQADMSVLDIGIDANSSSFVWDTITKLIQSHQAVFGMFISILSVGIIKLALGR